MRFYLYLLGALFLLGEPGVSAQTSDERYRLPLSEVLQVFEEQYERRISVSGQLIKDLELDYALWRFRPDPELTLRNILGPFDLVFEEQTDSTYRIVPFAYHKRQPSEGADLLVHLAAQYRNREEWEARKERLRPCLLKALDSEVWPSWDAPSAVVSHPRTYQDYSVENLALETFPGVFVFGTIYKPVGTQGKVPVIVSPNGHFSQGRYNKDVQARCAMMARMGAIVMNYDLFAWGESALQFESSSHRSSLAMVMQTINGFRVLDYLLSLEQADPDRVGITGGSGGGSQTMLLAALDERYSLSVPAVMLSSYFSGGCPCESGRPIHLCGGGSSNVELSASFAPKPQLIISDGGDWTRHVPEMEFPFVQGVYAFYNASGNLDNAHFPDEGHNYGASKRYALYDFLHEHFQLKSFRKADGSWDEKGFVVESEKDMQVFGGSEDLLPEHALRSFAALESLWNRLLLDANSKIIKNEE